MNGRRLALRSLLAISLLVTPPAFSQVTQIRTPVSFTLSGCTSLPAGVTVQGTGESFVVINSRVDSSTGITYVEENSIVTGKATDSNGASYIFNYHQHLGIQVPPGGFPTTADVADHFNLVGNGQANQVQVHFVARVTITSPTSFTFDFVNVHGDPMTCDPI